MDSTPSGSKFQIEVKKITSSVPTPKYMSKHRRRSLVSYPSQVEFFYNKDLPVQNLSHLSSGASVFFNQDSCAIIQALPMITYHSKFYKHLLGKLL
jgi:hypothetical protein